MLSRTIRAMAAVLTIAGLAAFGGCANGYWGPEGDGDGQGCSGGKCDALDSDNDPANLGFTIKYELADESMIGVTLTSEHTPYSPPTYFPFTSDGINNRHGGQASPAEKFDMAFNGWTPDEAFWQLRKLNSTSDREFDQAYYDQLGPVAKWEHEEHGLGRLHDGVDNDGDGKTDFEDDDNEGLEGWFGYCNGNTSASLSVPGPEHDVEYNGVTFTPYDIMALLGAVHYDDRSTMTGLRCEALSPVKDEYGRYVNDPWYKKQAGGSMAFFEVDHGPAWFDESHEYVAYRVTVDGTGMALIRLTYEEFKKYREEVKQGEISFDNENWEPIEFSTAGRGCRDTNPATLYLAVAHILGAARIPFGIDADSGSHVWNYPIYQAVINEQRLVEKEEANRLLGVPEDSPYPFNDAAVKFAYVKMTLERSHSMGLEMILELEEDGKTVIGGEWVGGSRSRHPDFIWIPMGADTTGYNTEGTYMTFGDDEQDGRRTADGQVSYNDAPEMAYSDVRRLLAASRTMANETFTEHDGQSGQVGNGQTLTLTVTVDATAGAQVKEVLVYMDATAEFVPGLKIELESPDGVTVKLFDVPVSNQSWQPGRFPQGWDLGVLRGVAHPMPLLDDEGNPYPGLRQFGGHPAAGQWTLRIRNEGGGQARLARWSLWLTSSVPQ